VGPLGAGKGLGLRVWGDPHFFFFRGGGCFPLSCSYWTLNPTSPWRRVQIPLDYTLVVVKDRSYAVNIFPFGNRVLVVLEFKKLPFDLVSIIGIVGFHQTRYGTLIKC